MKNNLIILRQINNMTQADLAEKCAVTRQTIISLENGRYNPSLLLAHRLAILFKKRIEEIFIFDN